MRRHKLLLVLIPCLIGLTGCGSDSQSSGAMDYKETKAMVIDILKTEDGQKAIEEANKKAQEQTGQTQIMQMLKTEDGQQIQMAVKEVLTDPNFEKPLKEMMTDPKFAGEFAKAVMKENKQLHKELMKDPEYQALVLTVMKDPEFEKMLLETMKGKEYRQQMMTVITEAMQNPLFKTEMMDLLKKVMEEQTKPKEEKKKQEDGGGESGGGSGGGS